MIQTLKVFTVICCCLLMACCATTDQKHVTVNGNINHLGRSELHITYYDIRNHLAFDTVYSAESGKFEFKVEITDEISPITIYFQDFKCWTTLFAQMGDEIKITGDIELVDLLNIAGGIVNDDLTRFKMDIMPLYLERQNIIDGTQQGQGKSLEIRLAEINLALKRRAKEFIAEHPSSVASVVLIQDFFYQDYDPNTKDLLDLLEGEAKESHLTYRLREGMGSW